MSPGEAAPARALLDAGVFIGALLAGDPRHGEAIGSRKALVDPSMFVRNVEMRDSGTVYLK